MTSKLKLSVIIGLFLSVCSIISIYHESYVAAFVLLIILVVSVDTIYRRIKWPY